MKKNRVFYALKNLFSSKVSTAAYLFLALALYTRPSYSLCAGAFGGHMKWDIIKELHWKDDKNVLRPLCAGSGLVHHDQVLWAVADDLNHLVQFSSTKSESAKSIRLFSGELPEDAAERKAVKKDLEVLFQMPQADGSLLIAFPSGSKKNRFIGSWIKLNASGEVQETRAIDFKNLILELKQKIDQLNIEGGFVADQKLILLQRGNGDQNLNALIEINLADFLGILSDGHRPAPMDIRIIPIDLGHWNNIPLSFTDGFYKDGVIYFAAAAEGSKDTYSDGEVMGSVIGALKLGHKPQILSRIEKIKIEGLSLDQENKNSLKIYGITDADDPTKPSLLLRTEIAKPKFED